MEDGGGEGLAPEQKAFSCPLIFMNTSLTINKKREEEKEKGEGLRGREK